MSYDNIRFFETQVIQHKNELIPCWKLKSKIEKDTYSDDDVNALYYEKEEINSNQDPILVIWDTLKEKVRNMEEIHMYPKDIQFKVEDNVIFEKSYKNWQLETIKEVTFKQDEISYMLKKDLIESRYL